MPIDFNQIIQQVITLHTKPKEFWTELKSADMSVQEIYFPYVFVMAAVYGLLFFLTVLIGTRFNFFMWALGMLFQRMLLVIGFVYVGAWFITLVAEKFGMKKDFTGALKLLAYSLTPFCLIVVLDLIFWGILHVSGLSYLTWIISWAGPGYLMFMGGVETIMEAPEDKKWPALLICMVPIFVLTYFCGFTAMPAMWV